MKTKVAVGISGGVDSATSAALLKNAGYEVVGVYLHCFPAAFEKTLNCTDKEDFKMAQEVAKTLGIPFTFFDLEKAYQEKVIDYFFAEYKAGRTPNPDAVCNKEIKFGLFLERAIRELGVDFVATGHYARIKVESLPYRLLKGVDPTKDQSYFLYNLTQQQLSRILFPLGQYAKGEVRRMAKDFGLPNWDRKDSQGICFLGKVSVRKFLEQRIKPQKGEVVNTSGEVIGEHDGVWFYTIGQRRGFRIFHQTSFNGPWYVLDKEIKSNRLIVGWGKECEKSRFLVEKVNWVNGEAEEGKEYQVRIRHLGELYPCHLNITDGKTEVFLSEPAWGVASGQVAVFYDGEEVLGGGVIV